MSLEVIKKTQQSIDLAFQSRDTALLEKETQFLLYSLGDFITNTFSDSVRFVQLRKTQLQSASKLMQEKNKPFFSQVLSLLSNQTFEKHDFKDVKLTFEKFFLQTTDVGYIEYEYNASELVSVEEAANFLEVTRPTVYKYMEKGLEHTAINNVKRIPRVALELWSDPDVALELQCIYQENKLRNQTIEAKLEYIQSKITELEIEFGGDFETLYGHLNSREIDGLDEAVDVFDWQEYIQQKKALLKQVKAVRERNA